MIDVLFFILFLPAILLWAVYRLLTDIAEFFGWLLAPAALSLYTSGLLFVVGPAEPGAIFESIFQVGAGAIVFGARLPVLLLFAGIVMLALGASRKLLLRRKTSAN
ncbi:hypothetical protein [Paraburkholderia sp. Ac-20347]|uniref:hypothetical protein n=1 Tax=Paraburkholderia sp. Ac-20347 TaxID=2703892 RepID=UPI00197F90D0|nr:hypothetical protein [Paraburkholderia sp. Ac-20347]MBN3814092.1 hypothetical protein [Paraburkholderia sp. Ac-20347]